MPVAQRFSQLSPARKALTRLFQVLNFGEIQDLYVRDSEPVLEPGPVVLVDDRLDSDPVPRPEVEMTDFALREEICRLMARLDELRNVTIVRIEVRAGIPRRVVFQSQFAETMR
jgi:hypothetical protein